MSGNNTEFNRRFFLQAGLAGVAAFSPGIQLVLSNDAKAAGKVIIQYDWLISNGQIGDVIALENGYFKDAGLDVEFSPGGPNAATVPPVVSGSALVGQFSETPQLFSARSNGVPVKLVACGYRTGPYAFTSKPSKPLRSVADLKGLRIGVQPTARFVIDAIAAKNNIDINELTIVNVGFDKTPLVRGDVDAIGGWITNTQALSVIGDDRIDLLVRDMGLQSYADAYFAADRVVESDPDTLARFIGAIGKGWGWTHANPQDAVGKLVSAHPELDKEWELKTIDLVLKLSFDANTAKDGWGTFDPKALEEQLALLDKIGQYPNGRPALEDVHTSKILELSSADRPKLNAPGA
ncbi:nitrate ABC transporter substrate-binding protein [Phyllobacterium brassicacearum]|uniref:Thiamine pyrimidine synthase n=1 Tax=Phyllobacterium brassicacearum TaxID=314235 RepID=A0A2P7BR64_9HYPH|nr:ABC transporter substrate-binding protein [Phyllobacterium brassicacearum]PSH68949.1 nitrate ABC transporter substrate-binding protein [Phyllobacterium brassicacearum]TDQ33697.1 NitT/TauT family transport system substrate-binding protein [Phyllobacterium brassicacearum]